VGTWTSHVSGRSERRVYVGGILLTGRDGTRDCAICLSALSETSEPVRLACGHIFHKSCISRWFDGLRAGHPTSCPTCRAAGNRLRPAKKQDFDIEDGAAAGGWYLCPGDKPTLLM
jgi:hypothetical protein